MLAQELLKHYETLVAIGAVGLVWPLIQAVFDRPRLSANARRVVAIVAAVLAGALVTYGQGLQEQLLLVIGACVGVVQAGFAVLKPLGVIDWVGRMTPGGEPAYTPRHKEEPVPTGKTAVAAVDEVLRHEAEEVIPELEAARDAWTESKSH